MTRAAAALAAGRFPRSLTIVAFLLISAAVCLAAGGQKEEELDQALQDIKGAVHLVGARAATAAAVLAQLQSQSEALKIEIQEERRRAGANSLRQAQQVRRIENDLRLLQQAAVYTGQLEDRLAYFRAAANRLNAYRRQVRDDRLMLRALDAVDSSALLRRIRQSIDEFRTQCAAPLLTAGNVEGSPELEALWSDIVKGR